jgi:glycolate oxidase iron-sulfur subunit
MTTPSLPIAEKSVADKPVRPGSDIDYEKFLDCVHCGLCTAFCPTYLETGNENNSPRGRIYLMRSVVDGRLELTPNVERSLDLCLDCRSCETACPSGVQYGRLIEPFRAAQRKADAARGEAKNQDFFHRVILYGLFPFAERMRMALWPARLAQKLRLDDLAEALGLNNLLPVRLQRMHRLLPKLPPDCPALPEFLPAIGPRRARVALFTGCVADAIFRHVHWATARVLQRNGCDVVVPKRQKCCGAIHYHSGADAPAMDLAGHNVAEFDDASVDAVIINVAGCGSMLKDYGHIAHELDAGNHERSERFGRFASKVRDVQEFLMELGPIAPKNELALRVCYQDACHLIHAQRVREQPRDLLSLIPGLTILPLNEPEICCGAAGSYNLMEPEMSDRLAKRKLDHILATRPDVVATANVGCSMQLQAALRKAGQKIPVLHPMELLDRSYGTCDGGTAP